MDRVIKSILTKPKELGLFLAANAPFWVLFALWPQGFRLGVILLAFVAIWSLWVARRERKDVWTSKLHIIWTCMMLWPIASAEANLELYYREPPPRPSAGALLVVIILWLTVRGVFYGEDYIVDPPETNNDMEK